MDRGEIEKIQQDMKVQAELKKFINNPDKCDFHFGHVVNDYKGDMHRFSIHASEIHRDMLVSHAKYLVRKIDKDLNDKGVTE